ncbi:hypothetical protein AYO20_00352 [Fonsecaea nubica]|uniref:ATPase AAA-type core domain-containing protein n=1 Tax=Fonsecaea nubica TaxID=856822 RepID=A0A178DFS2_9EURO|nr:hypothetical protein AYO20_00352 [Fonsecaea nubica]OAL40616.1 hypothetical protein AYO20_00352 [Fonsecaea nubica]
MRVRPPDYLRMHGGNGLEEAPTASEDLSAEVFAQEECPNSPFPMLLPSKTHGYHFIEKRWVDLEVEYIADIQWNTKAFQSLVTEEETKDLLEALTKNQLNIETSTDLIAGKGNGLIVLLHRGPGTGGTYTAESVADCTQKPLYRVTCSDIGTEPVEVEKYLETTVLRLGRRWSCVDEADIFLEERTLADLKRNALVSVFLRVPESYNGILILTSNHVGHFDETFKSRIQQSLHYESPDQRQRHQIWTNFIKHLRLSGSCQMDFDDLVLHVHGLSRLAEFRKKDLNDEILTKVIRVSGKFDRYLQGVKKAEVLKGGTVDEQIARDAGTR